MASSSSVNDNYDVFLSFRGEDTRYNFTSHLHKSLVDHNIKVFIDYNIRRGQEITVAIERVIEGAKISIIVFSKNYAESTFCLDELVKIMECRASKAQIVLPIFYKVEPSEEIYEEAFESHERETINQEIKLERWKSAFRRALGLAGEPIDDKSNEAERIDKITTEVLVSLKEINTSVSKGEEFVCTPLVGWTAENNFQNIWKCLMNDKIPRVGIYGMGGVGKTTIATRINNQLLEVANSFTHIYWVTVSKDSSVYNLQSGIAKKINLDLSKEDDEKRRAAMIQKALRNEKFVLILDDVWEAYELTKDVGLPCLVRGQKLLLTSRSRKVTERMECLPIEVKPLYEKEALDLFIKESMYETHDSPSWRAIVGSIVEECGGLPLAIVVIARTMRGVQEIWKWRDTLRELQKPCEGENPEIEDKVYKVLKFSFDRLRNDRCRRCFLYCSLFPEDYLFRRDDLIEYWIGEGLIDGVGSRNEELDKSNSILDELIHASLLQSMDEDLNAIKMHDVIRDMARMNVKAGLRFEDSFERVQVLETSKSLPNSTHPSKIKTLILQGDGIRKLSRFFANMESLSLNVLHMKNLSSINSIPDSISNLRNLRVLIINECSSLERIPSLDGLEDLRHLKISSNIILKEIPKGIERLVNLGILDLSYHWYLDRSFPGGALQKFSHLQALNLSGSGVEVEADALISLEKLEVLKVHFYNLHKLNCYLKSGHWERLVEYHIHYGEHTIPNVDKGKWLKIMSFKAIRDVEELKGEFGMFLPHDIESLYLVDWESPMFYYFKNPNSINLQTMSIHNCKSRYLFTLDLTQHPLCNVQYLHIGNCYELEEIIGREEERENSSNDKNYPTILLPNLKTLNLFYLPELRSIYRGRMVCPSLQLIQIYGCNKLERLPFCKETQGNKKNPTIKLIGMSEDFLMSRRWWDSLQWDNLDAKSMYQHPEYEGES